MRKNYVIYHRADFDGIFCREIARKFLPDAELVGWDYGDPVPQGGFNTDVNLYILDLSVPELMGHPNLIWIDHHKSAIDKYPATIPGYRIDGVAACRLAWQWFQMHEHWDVREMHPPYDLPSKEHYVERNVLEPLAVRLAGEYDIWDKRDDRVDVFQLGLRSKDLTDSEWSMLLGSECYEGGQKSELMDKLLCNGRLLQCYVNGRDAAIIGDLGFLVEFEGRKFLALNSSGKGSLQFAAKDIPETGHEALLKFNYTGKKWDVSLYHARHRTDLDLSTIAVKYGGGGHRGACGFRVDKLPFLP